MAERLDEQELKALLAKEIQSAEVYDRTELSQKRTRALEYYQGDMRDTQAAPNRSSVVSRDVADTMNWILPGLIRVFTASDRMAIYEPVRQSDEAFAEQVTDYCNHVFWKDNDGYRILYGATWDSLLFGNGIVKHWWDDTPEDEVTVHSGLTAEQIVLLQQDQDVEIVSQEEGAPQLVMMPGPDGQPMPAEIPTFSVKVRRTIMNGKVRIECIEPENFFMDRDATCIEDARFTAHRDEKTRSELIEMGFDRDLVENLPPFRHSGLDEERLARDNEYDGLGDVGDDSTRLVELFECYVKADVDGDGVSETVRAYFAGQGGAGELLDWEVWEDDVPFSDIPCDPVPHRWDARSIADETMDVQRIKTVLTRQMVDNLYWVNNPMTFAPLGGIENPEMLIAPKFGGTVWLKNAQTLPPQPLPVPFIGDKALLGLEHFDSVVEKRTGVSRATMALDPETLQNQTATASQNQRDAAYSQVEIIARNQAELGWRRVFRQILKIVVKNQDRPRMIRLRDEWVEMDPRSWNAGMDVTINVGLGTGSRDRDMQMLNLILNTQTAITQQLAQAGFGDKALDMVPKVVRTAVKLAESAGIRDAEAYYPEFDDQTIAQMKQQAQQQAAQGDPKVQAEKEKAQAELQMKAQEFQFEMQKAQGQMQFDIQKEQAKLQAERESRMLDMQLKREQMQQEIVLKREQLAAELQLKREMMIEELALKREMGAGALAVKASTSGVNVGGEPG